MTLHWKRELVANESASVTTSRTSSADREPPARVADRDGLDLLGPS